MHLISDVQIAIATLTAAVVLSLQAINLWRSITNGRTIRAVHLALDDTYAELKPDVIKARKSLEHVEKIIEQREAQRAGLPYGRRATDIPQGRVSNTVIPTEGSSWPISDA